eukprot:9507702-Lingulodinium_polyedra.AAC.1
MATTAARSPPPCRAMATRRSSPTVCDARRRPPTGSSSPRRMPCPQLATPGAQALQALCRSA